MNLNFTAQGDALAPIAIDEATAPSEGSSGNFSYLALGQWQCTDPPSNGFKADPTQLKNATYWVSGFSGCLGGVCQVFLRQPLRLI